MVDVVDEDGWVVVDADGMMEAMEVDDVEVVKELKKNKKSRRKSKKSKSKKNKKGKKSKKNKPSHLPKIPTTAGSKPAIVVFGPQHAREVRFLHLQFSLLKPKEHFAVGRSRWNTLPRSCARCGTVGERKPARPS